MRVPRANDVGAESFIGDRHAVRYGASVLCRRTKSERRLAQINTQRE
jgi:hypothetical protein